MSWVCVAAAAASVVGAAISGKEAKAAESETPVVVLPPKAEAPARCESCGSRKWLFHNNARICAYCRSEQ